MLKFIHIADVHGSRERLQQTVSVLKTIEDRVKAGDIDYLVCAGDFYDSTITNTKASGFTEMVSLIRSIEKYCKVIFVYGTPSHEPTGCLDVFASDRTRVFSKIEPVIDDTCKFLVIPEPRKSMFVRTSNKLTDSAVRDEVSNKIHECMDIISASNNDIPLVVVYHGEIFGAMYQNGQIAQSPIALSDSTLKSMRADYYACGHVHLPQELFANCVYSGSTFPKDFGEGHDAGYELVTIDETGTKHEHISFGFPRNISKHVTLDEFKSKKFSFHGDNVKFFITMTKDEKKKFNIKRETEKVMTSSGAQSVTIDIKTEQTANIRSKEITNKRTLKEKLEEYCSVNGITKPGRTDEMLAMIEDNALIKYNYPIHSFTLVSASIKGAIGLIDGSGREEVNINFDEYDNGVLILTGKNGSGKSTLMENLTPYPRMLTRGGKLKDHFCLKDSHRILVYRDENNLLYKFSILIEGHIQSGQSRYFVETSKDGINWKAVPDIDGNLDSYSSYVDYTFGSIDLFLRTAFTTKEQVKNIPDIASATRQERMSLFTKLAGNDYLAEVSASAKENKKLFQNELLQISSSVGIYNKLSDDLSAKLATEEDLNNKICKQSNELEDIHSQITNLGGDNSQSIDIDELAEKIKATEDIVKSAQETRSKAEHFIAIQPKIKVCTDAVDKLNALSSEKDALYKDLSSLAENERKEAAALEDVKTLKIKNDSAINRLNTEIDNLSCNCSDGIHCPHCKTELIGRAKEKQIQSDKVYKDAISKKKSELYTLTTDALNLSEDLQNATAAYNSTKLAIDKRYKRIREIEEVISSEGLRDASYLIDEMLKEFNGQVFTQDDISNADSCIWNSMERLASLNDEMNNAKKACENAAEIKELKARSSNIEVELMKDTFALSIIRDDIKSIKDEISKYDSDVSKSKELNECISALEFISTAFGSKGIQALELECATPEIADITNRILAESYGDRFEVSFPTQRKSGDKEIEDFNIIVHDAECGKDKPLDILCSGEKVWIRQALYYAFSIVRSKKTGLNFKTRFLDESDGSLDGESRPKYMDMVRSAHNESGATLTILITHSQEIKEIAEQVFAL